MQNSEKENEMVALKGNWIENAIYDNRMPRILDKDNIGKYKNEFQRYYGSVCVKDIDEFLRLYNLVFIVKSI